MFIIFGSQILKSPVKDGVDIIEYCPKCDSVTRMTEYKWQKYVTLFFNPIFQDGEKEYVLTCTHCNTSFEINNELYSGNNE